jgi:hypothetical protein
MDTYGESTKLCGLFDCVVLSEVDLQGFALAD